MRSADPPATRSASLRHEWKRSNTHATALSLRRSLHCSPQELTGARRQTQRTPPQRNHSDRSPHSDHSLDAHADCGSMGAAPSAPVSNDTAVTLTVAPADDAPAAAAAVTPSAGPVEPVAATAAAAAAPSPASIAPVFDLSSAPIRRTPKPIILAHGLGLTAIAQFLLSLVPHASAGHRVVALCATAAGTAGCWELLDRTPGRDDWSEAERQLQLPVFCRSPMPQWWIDRRTTREEQRMVVEAKQRIQMREERRRLDTQRQLSEAGLDAFIPSPSPSLSPALASSPSPSSPSPVAEQIAAIRNDPRSRLLIGPAYFLVTASMCGVHAHRGWTKLRAEHKARKATRVMFGVMFGLRTSLICVAPLLLVFGMPLPYKQWQERRKREMYAHWKEETAAQRQMRQRQLN